MTPEEEYIRRQSAIDADTAAAEKKAADAEGKTPWGTIALFLGLLTVAIVIVVVVVKYSGIQGVKKGSGFANPDDLIGPDGTN